MKKELKNKISYPKLNQCVLNDLKSVLNSSDIFIKYDKYSDNYSLWCATIERLESCTKYLNSHLKYPLEEDELITFSAYACILCDACKFLYQSIFNDYESKSYYFVDAQKRIDISEKDIVCDDKFFEYLRSLIFAHPFNTNRTFKNKYGIQVTPYILGGLTFANIIEGDIRDPIGVKVYTSKKNNKGFDVMHVEVSFMDYMFYINDKFKLLKSVTKWLTSEVNNEINRWKEHKTNKELMPYDALVEMDNILTERLKPNYVLREFCKYFNYECNHINNAAVNAYKSAIVKSIPLLQQSLDSFDYETFENILCDFIKEPCRNGEFHYQLEKIMNYLDDSIVKHKLIAYSNEEWGIIQAIEFSKGFAKNWVSIEVGKMPNLEIKLLANVACYLENHRNVYSDIKRI